MPHFAAWGFNISLTVLDINPMLYSYIRVNEHYRMVMKSIISYYQAVRGRIIQEVAALEAGELEGTDAEEWVKYYMHKYAFVPIQIKSDTPVLEERVNKFEKTDFLDFTRTVENSTALIRLPVEPNRNMTELLTMQGES